MKVRALVMVLVVLLVAAADPAAYRFTRSIEAGEGWTRLDLPDDVLAAARPGFPDLRIRGVSGDVPYALEQTLGLQSKEWTLRDVESTPRETTAILDRGAHPDAAARATFAIAEDEFLKPVILEASDDRAAWKEMARGSIFGTSRARMTTLRFAPNDRRYWRARFDDRNGASVRPRSVVTGAVDASSAPPMRMVNVPLTKLRVEDGTSVFAMMLPSANMAVARIHLAPSDEAFARQVRVYERVLFRDEVARRMVGGGLILRSAGQAESLDVALGDVVGQTLEIEVDDGASPPLVLHDATVAVEPRSLLFFAKPSDAPLSLVYGAPSVNAPRFDLAAALAAGKPSTVAVAKLGDAVDRGGVSPIAPPPRGAVVDAAAWKTKAPIVLPTAGPAANVAYLALDDLGDEGDLRIVDAKSMQVPYVMERVTRHARSDVAATPSQVGGRTVLALRGLAARRTIDGLTLTATAPAYFSRRVSVVEEVRDARGVTGERVLGSGTWERSPGGDPAPFTLAIAAPSEDSIEVRIENGDNAPIELGPLTVTRAVRRVDFVFASGDALSLLRGNASATRPEYDLALLEPTLLAVPAAAASLGPAVDIAPAKGPATPPWFWACVIAAGIVVALALTRSMRQAPPA